MINNKKIIIVLILGFFLLGCNSTDSTATQNNNTSDNLPNIAGTNNPQNGDINIGAGTVDNSDLSRKINKSVVETKPKNWYIKLVVEDPENAITSRSARFGTVDENDAVQEHTLEATPAFGSNYLDIVFRDPSGVDAGDYKVNFHRYEENIDDSWKFTVRSGDSDADIDLTWIGIYVLTPYIDDQGRQRYKDTRSVTNPLFKHMKLVDLESGQEIMAVIDNKIQIYSFNMGGEKERNFEWIVQLDEISDTVKD